MSDRVTEHFVTGSRVVTPASASHSACVLYAPVSRDSEVTRCCASVLSDAERERADRFVDGIEGDHFRQRRAFRRFCGATALGLSDPLSRINFVETENGRPYLADQPEVWLSFSSCRFGFLGAWSSTHGIGVDLEDQTRNLEAAELAREFFSEAEARVVERARGLTRLRTFYLFWSLKEAALKSIGEGLPFGLDTFEFELTPTLRLVQAPPEHGGAGGFEAHVIEGIDGGCTALVTQSPARRGCAP